MGLSNYKNSDLRGFWVPVLTGKVWDPGSGWHYSGVPF